MNSWKRVKFEFTDEEYRKKDEANPVYEQVFTDINTWKAEKLVLKSIPCKIYSCGWHFTQKSGHIRVRQSELKTHGL